MLKLLMLHWINNHINLGDLKMMLTNDVIEDISESILDTLEGCSLSLKSIYHRINYYNHDNEAKISYQNILYVLELLEEDCKVIYNEDADLWFCAD